MLSTTPTMSPPTTAPEDRIQAAENDHREHLEADRGDLRVDAEHRAPDDAAERRDDAGHGPGDGEVALDIDAHGHGDLGVVGDGAHGDTHAALGEEPGEAADAEQRDDDAENLDRRQGRRQDRYGLVADGQRDRACFGAEGDRLASPRRIAARPIVAMMMATTGRPSIGRSTSRSSTNEKAIMSTTPTMIASHSGSLAPSDTAIMKPASMTNSPWAKLIASVAL